MVEIGWLETKCQGGPNFDAILQAFVHNANLEAIQRKCVQLESTLASSKMRLENETMVDFHENFHYNLDYDATVEYFTTEKIKRRSPLHGWSIKVNLGLFFEFVICVSWHSFLICWMPQLS